MEETCKISDFSKELKKRKFKEKLTKKVNDVNEWYHSNPEMNSLLIGAGIGILGGLAKGLLKIGSGAVKRANLVKEERIKNEYCYDRSEGHYWKLKRPLTSGEWLQIETRKAKGEKLGSILKSMNVVR